MGWLLVRRTEARHQQAWKRNHDKHKHPKSGALSRRSSLLCKSIQCLILGLCFAVALTTFALSGKYTLGTAANVLIILLLIFLATLFLHVLLRTVMHLHRQQNRPKKPSVHHRKLHRHHRTSRPQAMTDSATALATANDLPPDDSLYSPTTPVRVHLLRDANLAGSLDAEKEPSITASAVSPISPMSPLVPLSAASVEQTPQSADGPTRPSPVASPAAPPAYGLWRCSVRADPNLLHWVKVEEAERGRAGCEGRGRSAAAADPRDGTTCTVVGTRVHDGSEEGNTLHHEAGQSAQQVTSHTVLAHPSNHSSERPPSYVSGHLGGDGAARGEIVGGGSNDGCNARRDTGRG
ncbi:MAG: hypothetical protein M1828_004861 [Chrysothrix sp. TS-e1954]|nr:MAG: hypothetical protein M1828_004861 [Chrysothrix sp. TS-e1954]